MTSWQLFSLFGILVALASIPSTSVALVVARSAASGPARGIAAALGIVAGDLVFVAMALSGMTALAGAAGSLFAVLRVAAGLYLVAFGVSLLRGSFREPVPVQPVKARTSPAADFAAGLFLTLGDLKAILFYASLFPAFVDLRALGVPDILRLVAVTAVAVGGVKVAYALLAARIAGRIADPRLHRWGRRVGGGLMIGAGGLLIAKP